MSTLGHLLLALLTTDRHLLLFSSFATVIRLHRHGSLVRYTQRNTKPLGSTRVIPKGSTHYFVLTASYERECIKENGDSMRRSVDCALSKAQGLLKWRS